MTTITGWRVTSGAASGAVLKLDEPVSFWVVSDPRATSSTSTIPSTAPS